MYQSELNQFSEIAPKHCLKGEKPQLISSRGFCRNQAEMKISTRCARAGKRLCGRVHACYLLVGEHGPYVNVKRFLPFFLFYSILCTVSDGTYEHESLLRGQYTAHELRERTMIEVLGFQAEFHPWM